MEIIIYIFGFFIVFGFIFLIIEFPYHLVGPLIFVVFYNFNLNIPGPLDLRGILTLTLFLRLIVFDKQNLSNLLNYLFTNKIVYVIIIFGLHYVLVTYLNTNNYKLPTRVAIFQLLSLLIGFTTVFRGYAKQTFLPAIIVVGLFSFIDLGYHYFTQSGFHITRVLDMLSKSEYSTDFNHNFFGLLIGVGIIVLYIKAITNQMSKLYTFPLILLFGIGVFLSTSRNTMLSLFITMVIGTLLLPKSIVDLKKIIKIGIISTLLLFSLTISFSLILSSMNISSEFIHKIHYRLVEEPLSIFSENSNSFNLRGQKEEGTIQWRLEQAGRDIDEFMNLPLTTQLFGYGEGGYFNIGKKEWISGGRLSQYISHNGYVLITIERGIVGLILYLIINYLLIFASVRSFKQKVTEFPFFVIIIFYSIFTFGAQDHLLERFGFFLFGGIIAQYIVIANSDQENEMIKESESTIPAHY